MKNAQDIPWTTIFEKTLQLMKTVEWGKVVGFRKRQAEINETQVEFNKQIMAEIEALKNK